MGLKSFQYPSYPNPKVVLEVSTNIAQPNTRAMGPKPFPKFQAQGIFIDEKNPPHLGLQLALPLLHRTKTKPIRVHVDSDYNSNETYFETTLNMLKPQAKDETALEL